MINNYMVTVPGHSPLKNMSLKDASLVRQELRRVGYEAEIKQEVIIIQ